MVAKPSDLLNDAIKFPELRVIGFEGKPLGVITLEEARKAARATGHDLLIVARHEEPPVARIVDYKDLVASRKKAIEEKAERAKPLVRSSLLDCPAFMTVFYYNVPCALSLLSLKK